MNMVPTDPTGKAIEETAKIAEHFLGKLFGPAANEIGIFLGRKFNSWLKNNGTEVLVEAKERMEKKGVEPSEVPPKILVPIIESGSLEDEKDMRDRWSAMLANAADANSEAKIRPGYPEILKVLSSLEAKILDFLYEETAGSKDFSVGYGAEDFDFKVDASKILEKFQVSKRDFEIFFDDCVRLGLCHSSEIRAFDDVGNPSAYKYQSMLLTSMGFDFTKACKY